MPLHGRNDWFHTHCACAVHRHNHSSATHPPLWVNATRRPHPRWKSTTTSRFNGHPPLGVNATSETRGCTDSRNPQCFNGHPPLGVNATYIARCSCAKPIIYQFQWAPTLGGECYPRQSSTLQQRSVRFNGHPPLGVNATKEPQIVLLANFYEFQWAPTLGGECYASPATAPTTVYLSFNGHPPLGVNATGVKARHRRRKR